MGELGPKCGDLIQLIPLVHPCSLFIPTVKLILGLGTYFGNLGLQILHVVPLVIIARE